MHNPHEFKVPQVSHAPKGRNRRRKPVDRDVADFSRLWQVGSQSNCRRIRVPAQAMEKGDTIRALGDLYRSRMRDDRPYARINPVTE